MSNNNSYLQDLEKNPGQAYQNNLHSRENLTKRENEAGKTEKQDDTGKSNLDSKNPLNYNNRGKSSSSSKAKAAIKKRVVGVAAAVIVSGGAIGITGVLPQILSGKIDDVMTKRFLAPTSKVSGSTTRRLLKCKLSVKCATKVNNKAGSGGADIDKESALGKISTKIKNVFKKNGGDVIDPSGSVDGKIKLSGGAEVGTGGNNTQDIKDTSPEVSKELSKNSPALEDSYSSTAGKSTANALKTTGTNKNIPFSEDVGNDDDGKAKTIQEQLDDQKNGTEDPNDLTSENAQVINDGEPVDFSKAKSDNDDDDDSDNNKNNTDNDVDNKKKSVSDVEFKKAAGSSPDIEDGRSIFKRSKSAVNNLADDLQKKSGLDATEVILSLACGIGGAAAGYTLAIKSLKALSLMKFAFNFKTTMDAIKAADGSNIPGHEGPSAEQFSQLMNSFTTVLKDSDGNVVTKSGTDSFGYQSAAGYLTPSKGSSFDLNNGTKAGEVGAPTEFTKSVIVNGSSGGGVWDILTQILSKIGKAAAFTCSALLLLFDGADAVSGTKSIINKFLKNSPGSAVAEMVNTYVLPAVVALSGDAVGPVIAKMASVAQAAASCAPVVGNPASIACATSLLAVAVAIGLPFFVDYLTDNFAETFLINPMPVGSDAADSLMSGMGAFASVNASSSGVPVAQSVSSNTSAYLQLQNELVAYNQEQDLIKREGESPFDIYNTATFAGSIMGNFAAAIYSKGNEPLQMIGALIGMFGNSFANILNGNSVYADAASTAYGGSCADDEIVAADIAADPFCNPIYGILESDEMELDEVMDAITNTANFTPSNGSISAIDKNASKYDSTYGLDRDAKFLGGKHSIGKFLNECVTRNAEGQFTLMGVGSEKGKQGNGKNCAISDSSEYGRENLVVLYNYINFFLANNSLNQGDMLGCEADGSCSSNGSYSSSSANGSMAEVAETMAGWGDSQKENLYNFGGGHGDLADLKKRIDAKFQPNSMGVDCSGFIRAVIYQSTGTDPGSIFANGSGAIGTLDGVISSKLTRIDSKDAQPGDLFSMNNNPTAGGHTGVVLVNNKETKNFKTAESYGGHGPGVNTRTYESVTIWRYAD